MQWNYCTCILYAVTVFAVDEKWANGCANGCRKKKEFTRYTVNKMVTGSCKESGIQQLTILHTCYTTARIIVTRRRKCIFLSRRWAIIIITVAIIINQAYIILFLSYPPVNLLLLFFFYFSHCYCYCCSCCCCCRLCN